MRKHLFIVAGLFLLSLAGISQANLVIFSEDGDAFYAYVNGIKQNDTPLSNVKVTGLSQNVSLRVEFADQAKPQLKQNMVLEQGFEFSVRIKSDSKKQLRLRPFGQTPIGSGTAPDATTVAYRSSDAPAYNTTTGSGSTNNVSSGDNSTSFNSTANTTGNPGSVSINMTVPQMPGVTINGMDAGSMNSSTSTTVTSSSSSTSSYQDNSGSYNNGAGTTITPAPAHHRHNEGCSTAMSQIDFASMKKSIADKPFSDTKMSTAKIATKNACLSSAQVKEICKLFNMDDEKLEYAKYAYEYCMDKANYYKVSEVFSFSATTDELNKFLEQ